MRSLPPVSGDIGAPPYNIIGNPELDYYIASDDSLAKGCVGQGYGLIDAHVGFDNIPTYTCISPVQMKAVFPKLITLHQRLPMNGVALVSLVAGQYVSLARLSAI